MHPERLGQGGLGVISTGLAVVVAVAVIVLLILRASVKIAREALDKIFAVAHTVDTNTMSLQYLETLRSLGASPASKFIFPMEFTRLLEPMFNHKSGA